MQRLIIIRGNSASGKSTVAKELRLRMGYKSMLIQQDIVRREILRVQDLPGNPSIQLIYSLAMYGKSIGYDVVIEGILHADKCSEMLKKLINDFGGKSYIYYFDIPFEETLRRHNTKLREKNEYGEAEMRRWWREKDYLNLSDEKIIHATSSKEEIINTIFNNQAESKSAKLL